LAAESGAMLYIVHVDELTDLNAALGEAAYHYAQTAECPTRQAIRDRLTQVVPTNTAVAYEHRCLTGSPIAELLKFADRENVDLIVMASHGRTGLSRLLMGSVAEAVVRRANCPVLIVKQPTAPETASRPQPDICDYIVPT
jgi:nucleotide-binding universal stress UspA family protein